MYNDLCFFVSVCLLVCCTPIDCTEPGLKVSLHERFFEAGTAVALKELHDYVKTVCFPDCNNCVSAANAKASFFEYYIQDLCVDGVTIYTQKSYVVPKPPNGLKAWLEAGLRVGGKWKIKGLWGAFSCDGTLDVTGQIQAALDMQVTRASDGRPHAAAASSYAHVVNLGIELHGSLCADILQLVADWLKDTVSGRVQTEVEGMLKGMLVDKLNGFLQKMDVDVQLVNAGQGIFLDYSLASDPVATASTYDASLTGEIFYKGHSDDPNVPMPIKTGPVEDPQGKMVCMKADAQAAINQINYAGQLTGEMKLDSSELGIFALKDFFKCDCSGVTCLVFLIPQLKGHCGPDNKFSMSMESVATGQATVASEGVTNAFYGRVNVSNDAETLVSIGGEQIMALYDIGLASTPGGANLTVGGDQFIRNGSRYDLTHSSVGAISQSEIDRVMGILFAVIKIMADPMLRKGIPLPNFKDFVMYVNPVATFVGRTLTICLDLKYIG